MAKNSVRGSGGDNSGRTPATETVARSQPKSLATVRNEQAALKQRLALEKKIQAAQKKGVADIEAYRLKLQQEYVAQLSKEKANADRKAAKTAEKEELVARARQRQEEKMARKEAREDAIAAAREAALEQIEGANTLREKLKGVGKLMVSGLAGWGEEFKSGFKESLSQAATNAVNNVSKALSGALDTYLNTYTQYMSGIEARIQGAYAGIGYEELEQVIRKNTAGSPFIRYEDALSNLNELVKAGTAVNLTQRAYLATISDKIATTFDALEPSLLRLIRIQQADTTAARLGMEAELTKLFNYYFSDTSYLSQAFDSVASAMTDLSSQLSATGSVEFDYMVQKWLGSLGSVGVEDSTLTSIAGAINALGTGQVDYLSSNEAMQNLLVLSANRVGLDYGEMLLEGINATDVNRLLYGVVDYIQSTVSGANNVVKAQYAQLFGLTIADINAFENISDEVLKSLYKSAMTYKDTISALDDQIREVPNRIHLSTMIDNVFANVLAATGTSIAGNAGLFGTYKAFDMLEKITGGIHIPTITVFGSGIELPDSIEGMVKAGIVGIGTAASLISAIGNWTNGAGLDRGRWASDWDTWEKGTYTGFTSMGELQTTKSSTGLVSNTNNTGMQQSVYDEQQKSAEEISGKEEAGEEDSQMVQLLTRLVDFFEKSGSKEAPMHVQLFDPTPMVGNGEDLSLFSLLRAIRDRLNNLGTDENPVYAINDALYGDLNNDMYKGKIWPGPSLG